jgi:hypothetical protein
MPEEQEPKTKGHWPKGKSRNIDPARTAAARNLADLLRRAITQGWRHPTIGVLSYRVVGEHLKVDHKTVHKWAKGVNLPPLWAVDELRIMLHEYRP